jgi:hypothetical protein
MRILLLDQFSEMGGAQRCLVDVVAGFAERGWETHAAVPEGDLLNRLRPLCQSVRPIPCGPFQSFRKTAGDAFRFVEQVGTQRRVVREALNGANFDVVYVNGPRLMPAVALEHVCVPVVFHSHSIVRQPAAAMLLRAGLRAARASLIASSRFVAGPLTHAATGGMRVILNGVQSCAPVVRAGRERITVAVLGRVAPEKGQLEFVQAARIVRRSADCRFIIAGSPMFGDSSYSERVRAEARDSGVEHVGWVESVPDFLARVDLLVVPSGETDATPRVIAEAFSAGTPVLAIAVGGIPEMIRDGEDGLLVRERSPDTLAEAIAGAVRSPHRLLAIAERARLRWLEAFTVERFQSDICEAVQEAAQRRHHRNPLARTGAIAKA